MKVESEMKRLANRLVEHIPMPCMYTTVCQGQDVNLLFTICLLNIRLICNKLEDLKCDPFLQSVSVLCICETSL